jgi:hypothetical protein
MTRKERKRFNYLNKVRLCIGENSLTKDEETELIDLIVKARTHLKLVFKTGEVAAYKIHRNRKYTPSWMCVEYDDYYEIACHSFCRRINKQTLKSSSDIKISGEFQEEEGILVSFPTL